MNDLCEAGVNGVPEHNFRAGGRAKMASIAMLPKPTGGRLENSPTEDSGERKASRTYARPEGPIVVPRASVVDLFCGAGGLSHGFRQEGFKVAAGVDVDERCRHAFEHNNRAPFKRRDVSALHGGAVKELFDSGSVSVLVGCAPCQPFSVYNQKNRDPQWHLLEHFARIIAQSRPSVVSMENVPRLVRFQSGDVFARFVDTLNGLGYRIDWRTVFAPDYGVPQRRARLVLLASRLGRIAMEGPTHAPCEYKTVADTIRQLPALAAGEADEHDPLHRSSGLSDLNLERIRAARAGGTWREWDDGLIAKCHKVPKGRTYPSVYGRMEWDAPSPTITTQFFGFGNGRFGHPEQDRGLSLREGALLQSFPREYSFVEPGSAVRFKTLGRMIGNAVPVLLARAIARTVKIHLEEYA